MIDLEKQKENFKDHIATFTDYGNIKILDFKNPDSNNYRIRFLFEEDYYRLHISGDLGELIATNYNNMTFEKFSDFASNIGYFKEKIDCHSRPIYYYDENKTKKEIIDYFDGEEELLEYLENHEDYEYYDDDEIVNEFFSDVFLHFDDLKGIGSHGYDVLSKLCKQIGYDECYMYNENFGKESTGILDLYMLAFKLAKEQLN